ncbi:hypothetical protein PNEG_01576 [Pneumocystis murina B123]|uniref:Pre-mRNA-processing factor 19 n=1 Tax=Pneumocystis murina (strain B123) TaxID=1069680 RepID=M7P914_PNEMU|nr:hypothetical protein PNEG_01576 [Pneumocystis murina B123]EMR10320.1 hypothetical protein PNEG_01576 [Pneumocystis murina B123]
MFCALSGESIDIGVVSKKSGNVYEKRLIEAYIQENEKDPVTGEPLTLDDLVELKTSKTIRGRPPQATSIPSLLAIFQNEWDSLALETYNLKQQLNQARQELSTALYQHDAACRVIARLLKERDEAREALKKIKISLEFPGTSITNNEQMDVDAQALPEHVIQKIDETQKTLSSNRRKRKIPADWTTVEQIQQFKLSKSISPFKSKITSIAITDLGNMILVTCKNTLKIYYVTDEKPAYSLKSPGGEITCGLWIGELPAIAKSDGTIHIYTSLDDNDKKISTHESKVISLALHPSNDLLASATIDGEWALHDLQSDQTIAKYRENTEFTCAKFHPDGYLFACGTIDGLIKIYNVKTGKNVANFDSHKGSITSLCFSENGYWLSVSSAQDSRVHIWDLRNNTQTQFLQATDSILSLNWDYTGQYLAIGSPKTITLWSYSKSTKSWTKLQDIQNPVSHLLWGSRAATLFVANDTNLTTFSF